MAALKSLKRLTGLDGSGAVLGMCVLLALAVWLAFGQTLRFDFLNYDDNQYFSANPQVQAGLTWSGVAWAFQTTYAANWHPLTWLSLMLDAELFGPGPAGPHLTNVLLHAANTVLLFLLLWFMTGAYWRSALVAALFGVHPLHVESVAWVSERKDVLSGLFFMLTLWAYANYVSKGNIQHSTFNIQHSTPGTASLASRITFHVSRSYVLCLFCFACGLMSKPMLVTLPFVLLLLDFWPMQRLVLHSHGDGGFNRPLAIYRSSTIPRLLLEKLPFLVLAIASCVVTYGAQRGGETMVSLGNLPLGMRIANGLLAYVSYLGKAFWPVELAVFYPIQTKLSVAAVLGAGAGLVGITAAVIWRARREPWLATGWFWFLGMLVPVVGLVQVGGQAMADRYTYVPLIGVFIMLCWSVPYSLRERRRMFNAITCGVAVAGLAVCAVWSKIQAGYWKDSETLFRHALDVTRDNWLAHYNLGAALGQAGRYEDAIGHYEQVLRIKPNYLDAHYNLAGVLARLGRLQEAIRHWEQVLEIKPDYAEVHYDLGLAAEQTRKLNEAIGHYEQALWIKPHYAEAHYNLANILAAQDRSAEAIDHFQKALEIKPDYVEAHNNFGVLLTAQDRSAEAMKHYQQALEISPDYAEAHYNLGTALAAHGRYAEAIGHFQKALQIKPNDANIRNSLNAALVLQASP